MQGKFRFPTWINGVVETLNIAEICAGLVQYRDRDVELPIIFQQSENSSIVQYVGNYIPLD